MPAKDRPPSFQFYPRDFMADEAVQTLTWAQRGRYFWALCCTAMTPTPGIAPEEDWRLWMGYSPEEWATVRDAHGRCFQRCSTDANWIQKRTVDERKSLKKFRKIAGSGGDKAAANLTDAERSERARNAANARWNANGDANRMLADANTASASASASQNQSQKTPPAAPPRSVPAKANGKPTGPDLAMISAKLEPYGPAKVREVIQLAWNWWNGGYRRPEMVVAMVEIYVQRKGSILQPFAYFNPEGEGFKRIVASLSADSNIRENDAFKREPVAAFRTARMDPEDDHEIG
jgi:uncharacterized protein YdaU (DUF1376 family)